MHVPKEFLATASELAIGGDPLEVTTRELLGKFGLSRRTAGAIQDVKRCLREHGLRSEPDFAEGWLDRAIRLVVAPPEFDDDEPVEVRIRVRDVPSATKEVARVNPDDTLDLARSRMVLNDYTQLAVMQGPRSLKGHISWESIGRAQMRGAPLIVKDAMMATVAPVKAGEDLLPLSERIASDNFVFVEENAAIVGIVTAADFTAFLDELAQPFLLIGELERSLRILAQRHFPIAELRTVRDPADDKRVIESVEDLSLGELARFLEKPAKWDRLNWFMDRVEFSNALDTVRNLRNDLMHFSPDPPTAAERAFIRRVTNVIHMVI